MELFSHNSKFDFIGKRWIAFVISGVMTGGSVILLATRGLNKAIDFTGGYLVRVTYQSPQDIGGLRKDLVKAGYGDAEPQQFTGTESFQIRIKGTPGANEKDRVEEFVKALGASDPAHAFTVDSQEYVGPTVGQELFKKAVLATVFSMLGIVVYVAFRFSNPVWGLGGIVALAHDVLSMAGLMSLLRLQFDLTLVAALLTLAGYSMTDTVVVYDRIRERMTTHRKEDLGDCINASINAMLSRTILTSFTVFLTLVVLLIFGGRVIHDFALSMTFGVVVGTYSSVAVATPIVYEWERRKRPQLASGSTPGASPQAGARAPQDVPQGAGAPDQQQAPQQPQPRRKKRRR
ncbi:MAG: protein translocase subunit SecF [Elusimicrobia bacterium]|nr:protein translocase subunit SecF [Elusimicrobiota bacterium]